MLIQNEVLLCLIFLYSINIFISCNDAPDKNYLTPAEYDLNYPVTVNLPQELDEISGIVYYPKDTSVFAISDENGVLYKIFPNRNAKVQKWKFGKNEDYEDLQLVDSTFYILSSTGDIMAIKFLNQDSLNTNLFNFPKKEKNEFESLYFDNLSGLLILICKDCKEDKKKVLNAWSFNPVNKTYNAEPFTINVSGITKELGETKLQFKPSAATINPITQEIYIISAINKALVIVNKTGSVEKVYPLNPMIYKQPEGIAFTTSGDLLICNESNDQGAANLLVIKNKRKGQ